MHRAVEAGSCRSRLSHVMPPPFSVSLLHLDLAWYRRMELIRILRSLLARDDTPLKARASGVR